MKPGIYYVIFESNLGIPGDGLVVVDKGRVYGGDHQFLYRGSYQEREVDIEAEIFVRHFRGEFKSVFGNILNFYLILSGKAGDESFQLSGYIAGQSHMKISVEGQMQMDLAK